MQYSGAPTRIQYLIYIYAHRKNTRMNKRKRKLSEQYRQTTVQHDNSAKAQASCMNDTADLRNLLGRPVSVLPWKSLSFIFNILKKNEKVRFRNISPARRASIAFLPRLKGRPHRLTTWEKTPGTLSAGFAPVSVGAVMLRDSTLQRPLPFALYGAFPDETSIKRLRRISFSTFFPDSARPASGMIRSALSLPCVGHGAFAAKFNTEGNRTALFSQNDAFR